MPGCSWQRFPFIVGFGDVPTDKNIEPVVVKETILLPNGQLFYSPMANPKEPRTHVTYLRLNLPGDSFNVGSVRSGDSFGLVRTPGWGKADTWQLSISGAVLALFNLDASSMDLINADYIIGFPLSYKTALKRTEIDDFRFHDLRHTFASHLLMKGASLKDIQELLGHKTMEMTLRSAHLSQTHKKML